MDRLNRLNQIWSWLPAFRAVAETENLQEASDNIHTSPPALSRSIGLLEETLGTKLFDREGRGLQLNERGEHFLETVRRSMRLLDEKLTDLRLQQNDVEVHVAFHPRLEWLAEHPRSPIARREGDGQLHLACGWDANVEQQLRSGQLDLVLAPSPARDEAIESDHLGTLDNVVACHCDDELVEASREERPEIVRQRSFVASNRDLESNDDGWPGALERDVSVRAARLHLVRRLCLSRGLLAVVPEAYVEAVAGELLESVPFDELAPLDVYALHRPSLEGEEPWSHWIEGFERCL
jgi:DNA-binding transcriptional LysR family regulator